MLSSWKHSKGLCFGRHLRWSREEKEEESIGIMAMEKERSSNGCDIPAYSPRVLLSRWLRASADGGGEDGGLRCRVRIPRHGGRRRRERKGSADEVEAEGGGVRVLESLEVEEGRKEGEKKTSDSSGRKPVDLSLNLGMGVGLVFLLVKSATEFNKMIELRKQMEVLLSDIKDEIRKKDAMATQADSTSIAFSASNSRPWVPGAAESDSQSKSETSRNKKSSKMDQLEAELEVELQRLHLNLEGNAASVLPSQQGMELADGGSSPESFSESFGEDNEANNEETAEHCGVSPRELERRLHELLEAQQQQRIAELESALDLAERRLHEKEMEVCWWRETARLPSKHVDGTLHSCRRTSS